MDEFFEVVGVTNRMVLEGVRSVKKFLVLVLAIAAVFAVEVRASGDVLDSVTGKVWNLAKLHDRPLFAEIENENGIFRVRMPMSVHILGKFYIGDTITAYFERAIKERVTGVVMEKTPLFSRNFYSVRIEYICQWTSEVSQESLHVNFERFLGERFAVGDLITAYRDQGESPIIADMPEFFAQLVVHGEIDYHLGVIGRDDAHLNIAPDTAIFCVFGTIFDGELTAGTRVVVVPDSRVIVLHQPHWYDPPPPAGSPQNAGRTKDEIVADTTARIASALANMRKLAAHFELLSYIETCENAPKC